MIRLITVAAFALAVATPAQAMTIASYVHMGCGLGGVRVNGVCVARATLGCYRGCLLWWPRCECPRWYGGACGWEKYSWHPCR
jgi:hypothetical protein